MTSVFLLRHPQTTWNAAERYQGRLESPLSETGWTQVHMVAEAFAGQSLDAVYTSPLQRTLHLARELSARTCAPLRVDQRLTEIGQLPWEGLHLTEIERRYRDLYDRWRRRPDTVRFPGGERLTEVRDRGLCVLGELYARYPAGRVAVVTHSVVIQVLAASALCLDLRYIHRIPASNMSVTTLEGARLPGKVVGLNWTGPLFRSAVGALPSASPSSNTRRAAQ
jgi:broad specificity phosphatase PhoE